MIRYFWAFWIFMTPAAGFLPLLCGAQTSPSLDAVLQEYQTLSTNAYNWQGHIQLRSQRMLIGETTLELKKTIDDLYNFSPLNPLYRDNPVTYFKSHAALDWNVKVQTGYMRGDIIIRDSITSLSSSSPIIDPAEKTKIHQFSCETPVQHPFSLIMDATQMEIKANISQFVVPQFLVGWHYPPRLWYPPLDSIGLPSNRQAVRASMQDDRLMVIIYTPDHMDGLLLSYLKVVTGMPELACSDLTNILLLDVQTFACRSFSINIQSEGKQRPVFSITHSEPDPSPQPFPIPSISTLMTSWREQSVGQSIWAVNYFCQYQLLNVINR